MNNYRFVAVDVESANCENLDACISIGLCAVDYDTRAVVAKENFFLPFRMSIFDADTLEFWKTPGSIDSFNLHVAESKKFGVDPDATITPARGFAAMLGAVDGPNVIELRREQVQKFADLFRSLHTDEKTIIVLSDCSFDISTIDYLLHKYLGEPNLTFKRLADGKYSYGNVVINTDSAVALLTPQGCQNLTRIKTKDLEDYYQLDAPTNLTPHDHIPANDCENLLQRFLPIYQAASKLYQ